MIVSTVVGTAIVIGVGHYSFSYLSGVSMLGQFGKAFRIVDYVFGAFMLLALTLSVAGELQEWVKADAGRKASERVAEALKSHGGGANLTEVSTDQILASVKEKPGGAGVNDAQLKRLVEQHKQDRLFDDEYFQQELNVLIVDYLQPLPRNAKRVLNRFRVSLLIAYQRGLLASEPKMTPRQIGKWLVLAERWPQLRRALAATPEQMSVLESQSGDAFKESIKLLSPSYIEDEDLPKFIQTEPRLGAVLSRLTLSN